MLMINLHNFRGMVFILSRLLCLSFIILFTKSNEISNTNSSDVSFHDVFDHFIIISMKTAERWNRIKKLIEKMGSVSRPVNYTMIGFNGSIAMRSEKFKHMIGNKFFKTYSPGEFGASLSHRTAWEFVHQENIEHPLIVEDDVRIDVKEFFRAVKLYRPMIMPSWKIIHWHSSCNDENFEIHGGCNPKPEKPETSAETYFKLGRRLISGSLYASINGKEDYGAVAYEINPRSALELIKAATPISTAADGYTCMFKGPEGTDYVHTSKSIGYHRNMVSIIKHLGGHHNEKRDKILDWGLNNDDESSPGTDDLVDRHHNGILFKIFKCVRLKRQFAKKKTNTKVTSLKKYQDLNCDRLTSNMSVAYENSIINRLREFRNKQIIKWCYVTQTKYKVVSYVSWGNLPDNLHKLWIESDCDAHLTAEAQARNKHKVMGAKCPENNKLLPLIAILAATTSRSMKNPILEKLLIFDKLLPSLTKTLDCEFRYVFVLGFDLGDPMFDSDMNKKIVRDMFNVNTKSVLSLKEIMIDLILVGVNNPNKKPGPVFNEMARYAYRLNAEYFYRINDDTEMIDQWPSVFVNILKSLSSQIGVVGPQCFQGHTKILTHDFVHRTHLEIFEMFYYPPELTDWWLDDWITHVYGWNRTILSKKIMVHHHVGAYSTRYAVEHSNLSKLGRLVIEGRKRLINWMTTHKIDVENELLMLSSDGNKKIIIEPLREVG